jgi:phosphatidylglycerophosphate synthase
MIKEKSKVWRAFSMNLGDFFNQLPLGPNFYTWSTVPFACFGFAAIVAGKTALGLILFIIAGLLDLVDGAVARRRKITSGYGAFLDGSVDRVVDFLVIFSYFWCNIATPWLPLGQWIAIAVFVALMPSFEVAYANHRKAVDDPHETKIWRIFNRGEMYFFMMLTILLSQWFPLMAGYVLVFMVVVSAVTTIQTFVMSLYLACLEGNV